MKILFTKINKLTPVWSDDSRMSGEYIFFFNKLETKVIKLKTSEVFIIGDCINSEIINANTSFSASILKHLKGTFIIVNILNSGFQVYSSMFGLFPIYYSTEFKVISNSLEVIMEVGNIQAELSKQYILECFLFNFGFSNNTYIDSIKRVPAFSGLVCNLNYIKIEEYVNTSDWFIRKPFDGKKNLKELAELFLFQTQQYFDSDSNSITFTGGFDGRTLVSAGLFHNKNIETFSWGIPENGDIRVPKKNAFDLKIKYRSYDLHKWSYIEKYFDIAKRVSKLTGGFNSFLYPHFSYCTSEEHKYSNVLLVGYCGSELFRALHLSGAITSADLIRVFQEKDDLKLKKQLWNSVKLAFINKSEFVNEFENLFEEIISYRLTSKNFYTKNHFFYNYVFSEVFRKVFGSLTLAQFSEMTVRIPYLDYDFVNALLKTDVAGCNNDFFAHNPLKRMKGQMLYSEIIRQSNQLLYQLYTDKGYRPCDLQSLSGNLRIITPYLMKTYKKFFYKPFFDNLGLISSYLAHRDEIEKSFFNLQGFQTQSLIHSSQELNSKTLEIRRDMLFQSASFASLLEK